MNVLLYGPEYRPNLSNMIRSVEFFGFNQIFIYDINGLLDPPNNKVSRANMNHLARVWTAGAIEHIQIHKIENIDLFLSEYAGRIIGTLVNPESTHLANFQFEANDLLIMGPEKAGLPDDMINQCDQHLFIPGHGQTDCLNVSVSLGIFLYAADLQLNFSATNVRKSPITS